MPAFSPTAIVVVAVVSFFLVVWICLCLRARRRSKELSALSEEKERLLPRSTASDVEYFGGSIQGGTAGASARPADSRPLPPKPTPLPPVIVLGPAHVKGAAPPPSATTNAREKDPPLRLEREGKIVPRSLSTSHLTTLVEGENTRACSRVAHALSPTFVCFLRVTVTDANWVGCHSSRPGE